MDPVQDREIFSLKDEKDEIGRFHLVLDDRLWRAGLEWGAGGWWWEGLGCGLRWERPTDLPWLPWQPEMAGDGGRGSTGGGRGRRRERGRIGGREWLGRAGSGSSGPDEAVRAGLPRTGRAGALLCARTGSCGAVPVHATRCVRAGRPPRHTCDSYRLPKIKHGENP